MRPRNFYLAVLTLVMLFLACTATPPSAQEVPRMTPADLKAKLSDAKLVILDVRTGGEWSRSPVKIKGAVRVDAKQLDWAKAYPKDSLVVLYCT